MSQRHPLSDNASRSSPRWQEQPGTPPLTMQEKLSERHVKREAKAAERKTKSDALKEEGNVFFRKGDYQSAVDRYQQAIGVHGKSVKPILLTNLAIAYYNLGKFYEASEAAEKALEGDPKSIKARYRRAMARKKMDMWRAAAIDFRIVLRLDPRYQEAEKELAYVEKCRRENRFLDEEDVTSDSEYELPAPGDEPDLGESLSESSDCEHTGNGQPCKFYNRTRCSKGNGCPFSHAPDHQSERDALGRNVCRYYLMGICKFGERCNYLHSREFLLQRGWWSTEDGIDKAQRIYKVQQKFKRAVIDYEKNNKSFSNPEAVQEPKKKHSRKKEKPTHCVRSDLGRSRSDLASGNPSRPSQGSRLTNPQGPDDDESESGDRDKEYGMFGFTSSEVEELLCYGIKPWDDVQEARNFLEALHDGHRKIDAL